MAVSLHGPDSPRSGTTRNARVTVRSVRPKKLPKPKNPKISWYGRNKPSLGPAYKVSKRGGGLGYVATRKPAAAAATPAAPEPTLQDRLYAQSDANLNSQQLYHQDWVNNKVAPWLSSALAALTGVDPNNPSLNSTMQQQYLANVQGGVGGALNAAAAATPAQFASTAPGGITASPTAYMSRAASDAAAARSSALVGQAQTQSFLNTIQPNTQSQGYLYALADYAKGLPSLYADKRAEARSKIDDYLMEQEKFALDQQQFAETQRHNRVSEATSALNAQTQAALGFGNLGLSTTKEANDQSNLTMAGATPAPYGYTRDPATGKLVRDPSVPQASSSTGSDKTTTSTMVNGKYRVNWLQSNGWRRLGAANIQNGKPKVNLSKFKVTQGADGKWWITEKSGSGTTAKPKTGKNPQQVLEGVNKAYTDGLIADDQNTGTGDLLRLLRTYQPPAGKAWNTWFDGALSSLGRVNPKYVQWIGGWVKRRKADGTWKGTL